MKLKKDQKVKISGASDDLLQVADEEFSAWVNGQTYKGYITLLKGQYETKVHVIYDGNWVFAVSHNFEFSESKPKYERSLDGGRGYSEEITIYCQSGTIIEFNRA